MYKKFYSVVVVLVMFIVMNLQGMKEEQIVTTTQEINVLSEVLNKHIDDIEFKQKPADIKSAIIQLRCLVKNPKFEYKNDENTSSLMFDQNDVVVNDLQIPVVIPHLQHIAAKAYKKTVFTHPKINERIKALVDQLSQIKTETLSGHYELLCDLPQMVLDRIKRSFVEKNGTWRLQKKIDYGISGLTSIVRFDATRFFMTTTNGNISTWNIDGSMCGKDFRGHDRGISSFIKLDSKTMISGSDDKTIGILDMDTRTFRRVQYAVPIEHLLKLDKERVAVVDGDGEIKIFNVYTDEVYAPFNEFFDGIGSLVKIDAERIAIIFKDNVHPLKILNWNTGKVLNSREVCQGKALFKIDSECVASFSLFGKEIKIWDVNTGKCLKKIKMTPCHFKGFIFKSSPERIVLASKTLFEGVLKIWNVNTQFEKTDDSANHSINLNAEKTDFSGEKKLTVFTDNNNPYFKWHDFIGGAHDSEDSCSLAIKFNEEKVIAYNSYKTALEIWERSSFDELLRKIAACNSNDYRAFNKFSAQ